MDLILAIQHAMPGLEPFFLLVTYFGSDIAFITLLSLYYSLSGGAGGRALGIAFGLSFVTNTFLKEFLNLPRPYFLDSSVASAAAQATGTGPGLPSGHAQMSATFWFARAARFGYAWLWIVAVLVVLLVSFSRLYLGVHFPQDVMVGLVLGLYFAAIADGLERIDIPRVVAFVMFGVLLIACFFVSKELAQAFGVLAGFAFARDQFNVPRAWPARIALALLGLLVTVVLYLGSGLIPRDSRQIPVVAFLRYLVLVLVAVRVWPMVMERFSGARA
jgi:membrane-associated phospholipid phosphatase